MKARLKNDYRYANFLTFTNTSQAPPVLTNVYGLSSLLLLRAAKKKKKKIHNVQSNAHAIKGRIPCKSTRHSKKQQQQKTNTAPLWINKSLTIVNNVIASNTQTNRPQFVRLHFQLSKAYQGTMKSIKSQVKRRFDRCTQPTSLCAVRIEKKSPWLKWEGRR